MVNVVLFCDGTLLEIEMDVVPRIGDSVWLNDDYYTVLDVDWHFDMERKVLTEVLVKLRIDIQ